MDSDRLAGGRPSAEAPARIPRVAAVFRGVFARHVAKVVVEAAVGAQRLQQDPLVLLGDLLLERAFTGRLGQEFGDRALEIRLHRADTLRPAVERLGRMKQRIVVELNERLQRHAETAAVIEDRVVVVGNAPGPRIEIETVGESAGLGGAAEFGVDVAAADRPVPAAGARVVFENLHLVARAPEFVSRRHSRQTCAEDEDRGAFRVAFEPNRSRV